MYVGQRETPSGDWQSNHHILCTIDISLQMFIYLMNIHEGGKGRKEGRKHTKEVTSYNENLLPNYYTESAGKINALYGY